MRDILSVNSKIKDSALESAIQDLIVYLTTEKKYQFDLAKVPFDSKSLLKHGILETSEQRTEIGDSAIFFDRFFVAMSKKLSFKLSRSIDDTFAFVKEVEKNLIANHRNGISSFYQKFKTFLLFKIHSKFKVNFVDYALTLKKGDKNTNIYNFNYSYCNLLPFLNSPVQQIYLILSHLHVELSDPTVRWNGNTAEIRKGLLKFCGSDPKKGSDLYNYVSVKTPVVHEVMSTLLQGMYLNQRKLYWDKIIKLSKRPEMRLSILGVLNAVPAKNNAEAQRYYNLIVSFKNISELELINLPRFYCSVLSNPKANIKLKNKVLKGLESSLFSHDQNLRVAVLSDLQFLDGYDDIVANWLSVLISLPYFDKDNLSLIDHVFLRNKSLSGFVEVLLSYATKYKLENDQNVFDIALHNFYQDQPAELSDAIIKLVTHNFGEVRFLGSRLIHRLTPHNGRFLFKTDILKLDAKTQYKLWVSIFTTTNEPSNTLPMLLPLINSQFPSVQELFTCKVEQMCEDYGTTVLEVLRKELDLGNAHNNAFFLRIESYCKSFWGELAKKDQIKELNPRFSQTKLFRIHNTNFQKKMNETINENVGKGSLIMQLTTTVILAKGGGWKHETKDEVQKLGHVMSSFQLPRSYFLGAEKFDWEVGLAYSENWENKFKDGK